jgi:LysR family transcriptional regulator for metE and metH
MSIDRSLPAPRLDVRDLRVVMALAREGTTAAASEVLHLTQSAVSRALSVAEDHAGAPLFTRTPRGLVPTAAGAVLLESAPVLLAELSSLERRLRAPPPKPRRFRFAAECHMAYPFLAQAILRLQRSAPALRLELPVEHSGRTCEALTGGDLDGAMLTSRAPPGLVSKPLFEDELLFLVAESHPLAQQPELRPKDLVQHPLLVPTVRSDDAWFMRTVFGARRPRLTVRRLPITEAIVELARAGMGIGILSEWVAAAYLAAPRGGLVARRMRARPLVRRWRLAVTPAHADLAPLLFDAIVHARPLVPRAG